MAEVVRYVDPDASGAGDGTSWTDAYTSRSAWTAAEATDLVTAGDSHTVYCRSSAGSADSGTVSLAGWTTGASNRLTIEAADGDEAQKDGIDNSRYRIDGAFTNVPAYTTFNGLQFVIADSQLNDHMIDVPSGLSTSDIKIQNCYFSVLSNTEIYDVTALTQESGTVTLENCIVYGPSTIYDGLKIGGGTTNVYHCVITASSDGIERDGGTVTVTDCAVFGCSDDFDGTMTIDHCASDDGDGTNAVSPSGSNWDNEFSDPSTGDFTLLNTGNCYHGGTTISGGPTYDIDGDEWDSSTPSIGADEYAAGGGTTYEVSCADGISLSDSLSVSLTISVSASDGIATGDSTGGAMTIPASVADSISLSDLAGMSCTFSISVADGIILSDQPTEGGVISVSVTDGITLSDSAAAVKRVIATISDGLVLSDSSSGSLTISAGVTDGITFSEAISTAITMLCTVEDGIKLSDIAVDMSSAPDGEITIRLSAKSATVTISAKSAHINLSAEGPEITFGG